MFSVSKRVPVAAAKPAAAPAAAAAPARNNSNLFIAVGSRPAAAPGPQQAVSDPAKGPLLYDPSLASDDAKAAAADDKKAAALSSECAVKEPAAAKDATKEKDVAAVQEPAKTEPPKSEPVRSRSAFLVPVVNRHPRAPLPTSRAATVCYVQRDGTCAP